MHCLVFVTFHSMRFNFWCVHREDEIYKSPRSRFWVCPRGLLPVCRALWTSNGRRPGGILTRFLNHLRCRSSGSTPSSPQMSDLLTLISKAEPSHPTGNIHYYPWSRSFSHHPRPGPEVRVGNVAGLVNPVSTVQCSTCSPPNRLSISRSIFPSQVNYVHVQVKDLES